MSQFEFKLPDIGEGVSEGEIVEWHVSQGQKVAEDDPMVEVTTDKASVTIGAPKAGTIQELRFGVGEVAQVGQVIVVIDMVGDSASKPAAKAQKSTASEGPAATAVGDIRDGLPGSTFFQTRPSSGRSGGRGAVAAGNGMSVASSGAQELEFFEAKPLATPATRRLARTMQIDLRRVKPTGPRGRVTKKDVMGHAGGASTAAHSTAAHTVPARRATAIERGPREERKPFVGIRRKIAERMQHSKNTAAHFTFVEECHADALIQMRKRMAPAAEEQGVKLTFLPFIIKAVTRALKRHPTLNTALDETTNELVYRNYYHVGVAAATDKGLMVPVVQDADEMSLLELAQEVHRLGEGARAGSLSAQELSGSTFTITSLGKQGGLFATPVLNHPEVGILGVHQMKQKPVVRDGEIVVGNVMLLSLSFDHRIVDGHVGAAFAYDVIGALESPEQMFLELR